MKESEGKQKIVVLYLGETILETRYSFAFTVSILANCIGSCMYCAIVLCVFLHYVYCVYCCPI